MFEHYWIKFHYQCGSMTATSDEFISCHPRDVRGQVSELRKKYTGMKVDMIVKL